MTPLLQFLDTHVNKPFKDIGGWYMEEGCYWWIDNKGFRQCGSIQYDGETSNLHSRLQETVKKREVPEEVIQGVKEFLEEMMALQLHEESPDEEVELSENCTANVNENDDEESHEDNYSVENEGVENDDDEINAVDL